MIMGMLHNKTTWLQIFVAKLSGASNSEVMHFHCKVCSLKYRVCLTIGGYLGVVLT